MCRNTQEVQITRKLFLFEWNEDSTEERAELLRADGREVETESADGARGVKRVAAVSSFELSFTLNDLVPESGSS